MESRGDGDVEEANSAVSRCMFLLEVGGLCGSISAGTPSLCYSIVALLLTFPFLYGSFSYQVCPSIHISCNIGHLAKSDGEGKNAEQESFQTRCLGEGDAL